MSGTNKLLDRMTSVSNGEAVQCPNCSFTNPPQAKYCAKCGASMEQSSGVPTSSVTDAQGTEQSKTGVIFEKISETSDKGEATTDKQVFPSAEQESHKKAADTEESESDSELALANGLPEWSIEPPSVVVRKRR